MKKISTLFFFFCCLFAAVAQDQEELDHAKFLKQTNQANEDRGGKSKYDSIYRTDKTSFSATSFLTRKDFFTYSKDGKDLTTTVQTSTDGKVFTNSTKRGFAYYPNGNLKVDSSFTWDKATNKWINSSKSTYLTYDANGYQTSNEYENWNPTLKIWEKFDRRINVTHDTNGFPTYYEIELWNKATGKWEKFGKYEELSNKKGVQIKFLSYNYKTALSKYLLTGVDTAIVLDNAKNPIQTKSYDIEWTGNVPTITNENWIKRKFDTNGNDIEYVFSAWDKTTTQYIKSDSSLYTYNSKSIYTSENFFSWDEVSSKWLVEGKIAYQVDPTTDLYTSMKWENWDAAQNAFYDRRTRKYFSSMLPVSTTDAALQSSFQIAPNPTSSDLHLMVNLEQISDIQVNVVNQLGQIVHNQHFKNIQNEQLTVPTQALSNGIYFIQIQSGDKQATKRFVKQ